MWWLVMACAGSGKDVTVAGAADVVECTSWHEDGFLVELCIAGPPASVLR